LWMAYFCGEILEIFPVFFAYVWVIATNHNIIWGFLLSLMGKILFELYFEYLVEGWEASGQALDRGADWVCGVS